MKCFKSSLFEKHNVPHLFASRLCGVSSHPEFESLNVSSSRKNSDGNTDEISNVFQNYKIILSELSISPENAVNATQVHSDIVLMPSNDDFGKGIIPERGFLPPCDGVILTPCQNIPRAACVKTADCVPILFANIKTHSVCAVHAGWRGTVADIAGKAVEKLTQDGGCASDIIAAIGPCIGKCCYEVSSEVKNAAQSVLSQNGSDISDIFFSQISSPGKFMANLPELNKELIMRRGVPPENIEILGICTCCHKDPENGKPDLFSHRASGGHSGTQLSVVATF